MTQAAKDVGVSGRKPYPEYKDSGVEWLGDVPDGWSTVPFFALYSRRTTYGSTELELLSVYREFGVVPRDGRNDNFNRPSLDLSNYQLVEPRDLAINKMKTWQGSLGVSEHRGIVSPAYYVCQPLHQEHDRYLHYLLRSPAYVAQYAQQSHGIRVGQWDLGYEELRRIRVLLPPLDEQRAIAAFLDAETARIDALIAKKERLLELLEEKRTALITQAVTKGLDPDVPMKDSGVEWIGEAPTDWAVVPIRSLAKEGYRTFIDGDWIESPFIRTEGIRLLQTGNIGTGSYREQGFRYIDLETFDDFHCTEVEPGDVLICRLADPVGRACLAPDLGVKMITSVDVCIVKTAENVHAPFVVYALSSDRYLSWTAALCRGGTRDRVSRSMLGAIRIPLPPHEEQRAIAEYLDSATARLDAAVVRTREILDRLRELRTAIISAAVTGKIDVRDAGQGAGA